MSVDPYDYLDGNSSFQSTAQSTSLSHLTDQSGFSETFEYDNSVYGYASSVVILDSSKNIGIFTPFCFVARIWDRQTGKFFARDDFSQIKFDLYKSTVYSSTVSEWTAKTTGVILPLSCVVEIGIATWLYDETEYNFIYNPNSYIFSETGRYYAQTKFWLTGDRLPLTITHSIKVS